MVVWLLFAVLFFTSGCHFCMDEVNAIFAFIPGIPLAMVWLRTRWKRRHSRPVCRHEPGKHDEGDA